MDMDNDESFPNVSKFKKKSDLGYQNLIQKRIQKNIIENKKQFNGNAASPFWLKSDDQHSGVKWSGGAQAQLTY